MASMNAEQSLGQIDTRSRANTTVLLGIAAAVAFVHVLTNNRYGFHRDELQVLSDALHLDWGFVAYPPVMPFLERIGLGIFGVSLVGLRLFSVIAQASVIFVTGRMARELGGGRLAQVAAALTVALSPLPRRSPSIASASPAKRFRGACGSGPLLIAFPPIRPLDPK